MTDGIGPGFWRDLSGLGGWVPLPDVARAAGLAPNFGASVVAKGLRQREREVVVRGRVGWMRKDDLKMLPEILAVSIKAKLRLSGPDRQEALELLDRPDFDGMGLDEIFEHLAADWTHTFEVLSSLYPNPEADR